MPDVFQHPYKPIILMSKNDVIPSTQLPPDGHYVLKAPITNASGMEAFVSQPLGWKSQQKNLRLVNDELTTTEEVFVDRLAEWILRLDFVNNTATLQPLRLYLMPETQESVVYLNPVSIKRLAGVVNDFYRDAAQTSRESLEAFRNLTNSTQRA